MSEQALGHGERGHRIRLAMRPGAWLTWGGLEFFLDGVSAWVGSWNGVKLRSGVTPVNGRVYTLVVIGPAVAEDRNGFWNAPTVTLVDNDPELQ